MKKFLLISIILSALVLMSYISRQSVEESAIFKDKLVNDAFIKRLKEENIQVRVSENGMVFYKNRYRDKVKAIDNEIMSEYYPGRGVQIYDPVRERLLLKNLSLYGIEYRLVKHSDGTLITWKEEDDARVHKLVEESRNIKNQ